MDVVTHSLLVVGVKLSKSCMGTSSPSTTFGIAVPEDGVMIAQGAPDRGVKYVTPDKA